MLSRQKRKSTTTLRAGGGGGLSVMTLAWLTLLGLFSLGDALKHSYFTKEDGRSLIGPIGFPFGFLDTGHFNLTVFDFELSVGEHDDDFGGHDHDPYGHKNDRRARELSSALDDIDGVGFLLKRFDDEAAFNHYLTWIQANESRCIFSSYLDDAEFDDDMLYADDDEDDYSDLDGYGEVLDAPTDGVFLSMKAKSRWGPAAPNVVYDFGRGEAGLYFLIYQICPPPQVDIHTRFELDFHFSNLDVFGNESYLSSGDMVLPHMFFYFSLLYAICLYLWISNLRIIGEGGQGHFADANGVDDEGQGRPTVYPIHHLMTTVLVLKTCAIFFESIRYHFLRVTGKAVLWSAVYYTFAFMKGTILFTVILLIGTGWSFVKPFLTDREKKMVCAILVLQVVNNIAIIVLTQETEGEHSFDNWTAVLHMVDILCCCAVLIPIVWQVNALEKNMEQSNGDHNDADDHDHGVEGDFVNDTRVTEDEIDETIRSPRNGRMAAKLKLFRSFYLLVVSYIYITRIVVYLFATMLDYRHQWLRYFVVELVTLAFYVTVGMQFRPMSENPYLSIRKEDDDPQRAYQAELELTS